MSSSGGVAKIITGCISRQGPNSFYWKDWLELITYQCIASVVHYIKN